MSANYAALPGGVRSEKSPINRAFFAPCDRRDPAVALTQSVKVGMNDQGSVLSGSKGYA